MIDPAQKQHPEKTLKCGECGRSWQARFALYCPSCGGKTLFEAVAHTPPKEPA